MSRQACLARARAVAGAIASYRGRRGLAVRNYRLNYNESRVAAVGIYDSRIGSAYAPLSLSDVVRGSYLVEWSDGRLSRGTLDGNVGADLAPQLEAAAEARHRDDEARFFPAAARVQPVPLYDPAVEAIVAGRFARLYDLVELIRDAGRAHRVRKISGGATASSGLSVVLSSRGLRHVTASSEMTASFSFDAQLWQGKSGRRAIRPAEMRALIERAARLLPALRRKSAERSSGPRRALLLPDLAAELVDAYVVGNLYGAEVATGQSAFRPEDFRRRRQFFRPDLHLQVDPWVPFSSGSYRLTSEGIASRRETYIESGRLIQPIAGVKFARRLGIRPTTPPASMESVRLGARRTLSEARALARLGDGLVLLSALGIHTQDTASGDYSLTAPQAIVASGGRLRAATKAVVAGNFFEHLRDERTELVRIPGRRFPGLLVELHASIG